MAAVTICSDFGAPKNKVRHCFHCSPSICHEVMGQDIMIYAFWMLSFKPAFHSPLSLSSRGFLVPLHCHKGGVICLSEVIDISPRNLDRTWASSSLAFHMMYSACELNKQGDNTQPWHTLLPIWNQSVLCPVLTVASWPAYRFLRKQVRWSTVPISLRIFDSLLWLHLKSTGEQSNEKASAALKG